MIAGSLCADAARFTLICERYDDFILPFESLKKMPVLALIVLVKRKIPFAVQTYPMTADKLRTGIIFNITFCVLHVLLSRSLTAVLHWRLR